MQSPGIHIKKLNPICDLMQPFPTPHFKGQKSHWVMIKVKGREGSFLLADLCHAHLDGIHDDVEDLITLVVLAGVDLASQRVVDVVHYLLDLNGGQKTRVKEGQKDMGLGCNWIFRLGFIG